MKNKTAIRALLTALFCIPFAGPVQAETMSVTLPLRVVSTEKTVVIRDYQSCENRDYPIGLKSNAAKSDVVCAEGGGACALVLNLRAQIKDPLYYYARENGACRKIMYDGQQGQLFDRGIYEATLVYPDSFAVQQYGKRMLPKIGSTQPMTSKYVKADKDGEVKAILTYSFTGTSRPQSDVLTLGPNQIQVNFQY